MVNREEGNQQGSGGGLWGALAQRGRVPPVKEHFCWDPMAGPGRRRPGCGQVRVKSWPEAGA